ncbi:f-box repeat-containing protein [Moumouvirus maliensis]|nr:f-box repeat-containing protein [Moumouvirus maliensis]
MSIFHIPNELLNQIIHFLCDKDKINFLSTCKFYHKLINFFKYDGNIYDYDKIKSLSYKDNIIHKKHTINNIFDIIPENISQLILGKNFYKNSFGHIRSKKISTDHKIEKDFWNKVTKKNIEHLVINIDDLIYFNNIDNTSIINMIIVGDFNQLIPLQEEYILGVSMGQKIIDIIPNSITDLSFQQRINNDINTSTGLIIIDHTHKYKFLRIPVGINRLNLLGYKTYVLDEIPLMMELSYKIH